MKFAFVIGQFEPTGGDRICYHHCKGLLSKHHTCHIYYQDFLNTYPINFEFTSSEMKKHLIKYEFQNLQLKQEYDVVIGSGLNGIQHILDQKIKNHIWFCQNFDPLVFTKYKTDRKLQQNIDITYQKTETFLTYSPSLFDMIEQTYGKKKGLIISNGVEYNQLKEYQSTSFKNKKRICFMSAYNRPIKGIKLAKQIFKLLKDKGYTIVQLSAIGEFIEEADEHYTPKTFKEKCELVSECDIMIHPSIYETWGLVPMESMALGTPVVGCDSKGFTQYAKHLKNSIIVNRNPNEFVEAIEQLNQDKELYEYLQKRGIETAKKHNWNKIYDNIVSAYETIPLIFSGRINNGVLVF